MFLVFLYCYFTVYYLNRQVGKRTPSLLFFAVVIYHIRSGGRIGVMGEW